jgi:hypothetical protein
MSVGQAGSHVADSQSVRLGFEPLDGPQGHMLACWEHFCIVRHGAPTVSDGQVCHMGGGELSTHVEMVL